MMFRNLGVHFALLGVAAVLAWASAQRPQDARKPLEVELWSAKPDAVSQVRFKDAQREIVLTPERDQTGRYLVGQVTKVVKPPQPETKREVSDAGVATVIAPEATAEPPAPSPAPEVERFIGVGDANEYVDQVAKLRAVRSLGAIASDKLPDFGLSGEELAEIVFEVEGKARTFTVGGRAPGGSDVYVRDNASGEVFVLNGDVTRDVELAQTRLMERALFTPPQDKEVAKVTLAQGDKQRALVHSTQAPSFWTDESAPDDKNETVTNWMKKFERLRIASYVEGELGDAEPLVTATFSSPSGEKLGYIEFAKQTVEGQAQPRYLARSPQTRWWAVVSTSIGSELAADLPSVLE
jgi:hypothetical protein